MEPARKPPPVTDRVLAGAGAALVAAVIGAQQRPPQGAAIVGVPGAAGPVTVVAAPRVGTPKATIDTVLGYGEARQVPAVMRHRAPLPDRIKDCWVASQAELPAASWAVPERQGVLQTPRPLHRERAATLTMERQHPAE
jgi:hypothetical protein